MNAPDRSITATTDAKAPGPYAPVRRTAPAPAGQGHGLDDVAALFPGMEVFHDLRISGEGDAALLCAVSSALNSGGARIISLSLRNGDCGGGQCCISCRLSDLTSKAAKELVARLTALDNVASARLEHVILRSK